MTHWWLMPLLTNSMLWCLYPNTPNTPSIVEKFDFFTSPPLASWWWLCWPQCSWWGVVKILPLTMWVISGFEGKNWCNSAGIFLLNWGHLWQDGLTWPLGWSYSVVLTYWRRSAHNKWSDFTLGCVIIQIMRSQTSNYWPKTIIPVMKINNGPILTQSQIPTTHRSP